MSPDLPPALQAALDRRLEGVSRKDLAARSDRVSQQYRRGGGSAGVIGGAQDALAYALSRLPATYAADLAVFAEMRRLAPGFAPRRLLDAGAGPGGASWAAVQVWPGLDCVILLDASGPFLELARALAAEGPAPLREAQILRADLSRADAGFPAADLVVASYALAEIAPERQAGVVEGLWSACEGALALIEPGTPAGFERLRTARQALVAAGAQILAPCPHDAACPIEAPDWCHFVQRLPRRRDHKLAKAADAPFEDEKLSYVVAVRPPLAAVVRTARILAPPRAGKTGIELKLCGPGGVERRNISRRDKAALARHRRLGWGDALPDEP